jgi:hypothetical protein
MGDEIESAMQHAPQPMRQSMIQTRPQGFWKHFVLIGVVTAKPLESFMLSFRQSNQRHYNSAHRAAPNGLTPRVFLRRKFLLKSKRFWLGIVITIVCLALAFQGIQLDKLLQSFEQFTWWWLPVLIATFMVSYVGRAFRWQALFFPYAPRWTRVFGTLNIGYFLSNITPARIGDFARAYLLGTLEKIPVARALSTVVVERALDGLTVVVLLLVMLPFIPNVPPEWVNGGLILGATGLVLLAGLAVVSLQRERGIAFLRKLASPFPFLQREGLWRFIEHLIDGFAVIRAPRPLLVSIFWSLEVWLIASVLAWFTMFAMGIELPFAAGALVQVAAALAVTVAASPGQLGVFHLIAVAVLTLYGVDRNQALAYAFVMHGITYLMLMALGLISTWREGVDLSRIQDISARNRAVDETSAPDDSAGDDAETKKDDDAPKPRQ